MFDVNEIDVNEDVIERQGKALIEGASVTVWSWTVAGLFIGLAIGVVLGEVFAPDSVAYSGTIAWMGMLVGTFFGWLGGRDRAEAKNAQGQLMLLLLDLRRVERSEPS
jgi:hypothetical protein